MSSKKILHVTSELVPYFDKNPFSIGVFNTAKQMFLKGNDVRLFMPRFGTINERRFQLHEVIRLSGMNLIINDLDQPLVIKVASLPGERMQVYFIENQEYFKRKAPYTDSNNNFYLDNDERAVFFARGVLETIKKLNWIPDVVHVHGWLTYFVPIYLKTYYKNDPFFSESKVVTSLYDQKIEGNFSGNLRDILTFDSIDFESMEYLLKSTYKGLVKEAIGFSDLVLKEEELSDVDIAQFYDLVDDSKKKYTSIEELEVYF